MRYHPVRTQRGLEILAGMVPWAVIAFVILGSFVIPVVVAYFVIIFNVYWLYRSLQMAINAVSGYLNLKATTQIDWLRRLKDDPRTKREYRRYKHVVIIPNVREPLRILERNVASIAKQSIPKENIIVVLAMEEREGEAAKERAAHLIKTFKGKIGQIVDTYHPVTPGETIGKHSNNAFAARSAKKILVDEMEIPIEEVIVTTCDADTVFPSDYLALLTYKYLTTPKPERKFYQAPLFMYNNLHRLPLLARLPNLMGGIYYLSVLRKASERFMNWSTYSTSLVLLDQVGYWDVDVIPEDWHINLKAYFALRGDVKVVPMYIPVYLDAAESTTRWRTYKNNYEQIKRWAWGIVDVPYVVKKFFEHPEIPIWNRLMKLSLTIEWHFVWSSSWFLITLGATIPTVLNPVFSRTALGYNLSRLSSTVLTICIVGILAVTVIDILLDPSKKNKALAFLHPFTYLQWIFLPIFGLVFGSLPGLESQTRLMLGKYLDYKVTEKVAS